MIEIKITNYKIKSDEHNYILYRQTDPEKAPKHKKSDPDKVAGYRLVGFFGKFEFLVDHLVEDKLRLSEVKKLEEVCRAINELKIALRQLKPAKTK